jgi:hypothetical protein
VGPHGIVAYVVRQREREIGVRVALVASCRRGARRASRVDPTVTLRAD